MIKIIAAMTSDRVIGNRGKLPWNLPEDLKQFKAKTTGHTVIMGRKTYESIGRPLPNRNNIVIGSSKFPGVTVCSSFDEALALGQAFGTDVYIIGGARVFADALPHTDELIISWVKHSYPGDIHFPAFDENDWTVRKESHGDFETVTYTRNR